jgi:hypothetical protein
MAADGHRRVFHFNSALDSLAGHRMKVAADGHFDADRMKVSVMCRSFYAAGISG